MAGVVKNGVTPSKSNGKLSESKHSVAATRRSTRQNSRTISQSSNGSDAVPPVPAKGTPAKNKVNSGAKKRTGSESSDVPATPPASLVTKKMKTIDPSVAKKLENPLTQSQAGVNYITRDEGTKRKTKSTPLSSKKRGPLPQETPMEDRLKQINLSTNTNIAVAARSRPRSRLNSSTSTNDNVSSSKAATSSAADNSSDPSARNLRSRKNSSGSTGGADGNKTVGKKSSVSVGEAATKQGGQTNAGDSLVVLLTQGLHSKDEAKIDMVLKVNETDRIQATVSDLSLTLVLPLIQSILQRLQTRTELRNILRWLQIILAFHMPYLTSSPEIGGELLELREFMTARSSYLLGFLSLQGRLHLLLDQSDRAKAASSSITAPPKIFQSSSDDDGEDENMDDDDDELNESLAGGNTSGDDDLDVDWWDEEGNGQKDDDDDDDEEENDESSASDNDDDDSADNDDDDDDSVGGDGDLAMEEDDDEDE